MSTIASLASHEIELKVLTASRPAVLDFYQASCPPCRTLEPRLERVAKEHGGRIPVYRVDIDRDLQLAERFNVKSLPTILVVHRGQEVERLDGLITDEDLKGVFDRAKARPT